MIERVARAMDPQTFAVFDKYGRDGAARQYALRQARAAIQAMREPDEKMICTGQDFEESPCECVWQAMIDAALEEADPPEAESSNQGERT